MNVHHHHYYGSNGNDTQTLTLLQQILTIVKAILTGEKNIMSKFDDLKTAVLAEVEVDKAVETLVEGLIAQLKAIVPGPSDADVQALIDTLSAEKKTLGDLVAANTPAPAPIVTPAAAAVIVNANPMATPVVDTVPAGPVAAPVEAPVAAPVAETQPPVEEVPAT